MSEYNTYNEEKVKTPRKKKVKLKPKAIFGILGGTFLLFIISFLLSYMLMNHSPSIPGGSSLQEENEELKAKIEQLEKRLEKYEDVDNFADADVPDEYSGPEITAGSSEPATKNNESKKTTDSSKNYSSEQYEDTDNNTSVDEEESAYQGIITEEDIPANTGISDAPVEVH